MAARRRSAAGLPGHRLAAPVFKTTALADPRETNAGGVPVSAMIFTLNEEIHLPRCLDSLGWCADVIVVDSFSTDSTERICRERGVRFVQHAFDGFGTQRNWALANVPTRHPWVLILDADERVPDALAAEIGRSVRSVRADVDPSACQDGLQRLAVLLDLDGRKRAIIDQLVGDLAPRVAA